MIMVEKLIVELEDPRKSIGSVCLQMAEGYFRRYGNGPAHWKWLMVYGAAASGADYTPAIGQMEWSGPKK